MVIQLAHAHPLAGHLGAANNTQRIRDRFHWPGLEAEVKRFCQACPVCQKTSPKPPPPTPLIPLPIIEVPFERIGMDLVGPLPKSARWHEHILVIVDYATRYPEAIPLRKATAKNIAHELFMLFSRVGIPAEILTEQGTLFMSRLMADLCRLLRVKQLRTTVYHPQTDGLVERFNQTLKQMLRRLAAEDRRDWDQMLPYVLFGIREVPQASTGFTPFELLFGRQPRGLLDVAKEAWEHQQPTPHRSLVEHVAEMRQRIDRVAPLVREHMAKAQQAQQRHYNRAAQPQEFQTGDRVMVRLQIPGHLAGAIHGNWEGRARDVPAATTRKTEPWTTLPREPAKEMGRHQGTDRGPCHRGARAGGYEPGFVGDPKGWAAAPDWSVLRCVLRSPRANSPPPTQHQDTNRSHCEATALPDPRGSSAGYWGRSSTDAEVRGDWTIAQPVVQPNRLGPEARRHPPLLQWLSAPKQSLWVRRVPNAPSGWTPGSPGKGPVYFNPGPHERLLAGTTLWQRQGKDCLLDPKWPLAVPDPSLRPTRGPSHVPEAHGYSPPAPSAVRSCVPRRRGHPFGALGRSPRPAAEGVYGTLKGWTRRQPLQVPPSAVWGQVPGLPGRTGPQQAPGEKGWSRPRRPETEHEDSGTSIPRVGGVLSLLHP